MEKFKIPSPAQAMKLLNELLAPKWEVAKYNPITKKFIVKKIRKVS